jgi:hypothetical protein
VSRGILESQCGSIVLFVSFHCWMCFNFYVYLNDLNRSHDSCRVFFRIPAWKHLGSFDGDLAKVKYYSLQLITLYYWEKDGKRIDPIWSNIININQAGSRWYFILGGMDYPFYVTSLNLDVWAWKIGLERMSRSLDQGFYSFGCGSSHLLEQKACSEWFCAHPSGMKEHSPNLWLRWDLPLR